MMEAVIRMVIENALVFSYCSDDQIAEDFAVQQLDRIAGVLQESGNPAIETFLREVAKMAVEASDAGDSERAERLSGLPSHLGIG